MKSTLLALLGFILATTPLAATAQQSSDGSAITVTGYTGPGGVVTIAANINGLPLTITEESAFYGKSSLTSVIGGEAFGFCQSLNQHHDSSHPLAVGGAGKWVKHLHRNQSLQCL